MSRNRPGVREVTLRHGPHTVRVVIQPSPALPEKYDRVSVFVDSPSLIAPDEARWEMDVRASPSSATETAEQSIPEQTFSGGDR